MTESEASVPVMKLGFISWQFWYDFI